MVSMTVELRNVEDTQAAMGSAGGHTIIVDRPEGKAGGMGLGFNGGQLLGGCFCNDLRYVAAEMGVRLDKIAVTVTLNLEGKPLLATSSTMTVSCTTLDGSDPAEIITRAAAISTVSNSLRQGMPVSIETAATANGLSEE